MPERRSLDLLLVNDRGGPIAAELKVAEDRPSYYALIQALMYASELQSPSQRARLLTHYRAAGIRSAAEAPLIDVYLVSFEPPERSRYRDRFDAATKAMAKNLTEDERFAGAIGWIASIEARTQGDEMVFEKHFAYRSYSV